MDMLLWGTPFWVPSHIYTPAVRGVLQIQDQSPQLRPVATLNQSQTHSDATGLNCGDRSWICNTPLAWTWQPSMVNFTLISASYRPCWAKKLTIDAP